jgi:hypothetical protein
VGTALALAALLGCSREKSIVQNPLLTAQPVVFILRDKPTDVQAMLDSIAELPGDSVQIPDTVFTTVDDTVWFVGHFGGVNNVRAYSWQVIHVLPGNASDSTKFEKRTNDDLLGVAFPDSGNYQAIFKLTDNIGGSRSAGMTQWIRVINTKPRVELQSDTTRTSSKGPALFHFFAVDSFGMVPTIRMDYNFDGTWDTTLTWDGTDSIPFSLTKNTAILDSLNNQRVVIGVLDDDGNEGLDTLTVHFNFSPTIFQDLPIDSGKVSIFDRFAFYWHSEDLDNPKDLRYFLRVGKVPVLTNTHQVLSNSKERSWEQVDIDSNLTDTTLHGNLYWQVWAHDGFDTVYSPVRKFFLGDPSIKYGQMRGTIRMEGADRFDGVRVTLISMQDGSRLITSTDATHPTSGTWSIQDVEPGCYLIDARDTVDLFYTPASKENICVELSETTIVDTMTLQDNSRPRIARSGVVDTLYRVRNLTLKGVFADSGSLCNVSTKKAWLDNVLLDSAHWINTINTSWTLDLTALSDGMHRIKIIISDNAGNVSDTARITFKVLATQINFSVAGPDGIYGNAVVVRGGIGSSGNWTQEGDSLHFRLVVDSISPNIDSVYFDLLGTGFAQWAQGGSTAPGQQVFSYHTVFNQSFDSSRTAYAILVNDSGYQYRDTVTYRVRDRGNAAVLFSVPGKDTTVSLNDTISLAVSAQASDGNTLNKWEWDIDGNLSNGYEITNLTAVPVKFPANSLQNLLTLRVRVSDSGGSSAVDSVTVSVLADPPSVVVAWDRDTVKINGDIQLNATASDKAPGQVLKWEWSCNGGAFTEQIPGIYTVSAMGSAGTEICIIRITDNDGETASDTSTIVVRLDKPFVRVLKDSATVTLYDSLKVNAQAVDTMGSIAQIEWSCGLPGNAGALDWITVSKTDTVFFAPNTSASLYYCVIRVTDDDGQTASDTTKYKVLQDVPRVSALDQSLTVTINDSLKLDAAAFDSLGRIIKYEWSCGLPGYAGVNGWKTVSSPDTVLFAPKVAADKWYCVIRVTDDDTLKAMDTTTYKVLFDAPRVTVVPDSMTVGINTVVDLDAIAFDSLGRIIRHEWSCGAAGEAGVVNWKTTTSSSTTAKMPANGDPNYLCVIRVMDDDSSTVRDTTFINVEQDVPQVHVKKAWISTRVNDEFLVDCEANDKFGVTGFRWSCGQPGVAGVSGWTPQYVACGVPMTAPATGTATYICVVEVTDQDNQKAFDTANVVVVNPPQSIVTATSKLPVWSGDNEIPETDKYWNQSVSGISSVIGSPFGDVNSREFWWNFSNYQPTAWFLGPEDGTIDVSYADFDVAFLKPTQASTVRVRLDFRDSILPVGETDSSYIYDFLIRHLDYDSAHVEFARYWQSQGPDTVIEKASRATSTVADNNGPYVAYRESVNGSGWVKHYTGGAWVIAGAGSFGASVDSVRLARDPTTGDLYVAYRDAGAITIKKSVAGTGAWTLYGGTGTITVNGTNPRRIALAAKSGKVAVAWIGGDSLGLVMTSVAGAAWGWNNVAAATGAATNATKSLEIAIAFNAGATDSLAVAYTSSTYKARVRLAVGTNLGTWRGTPDIFSGNSDAISLAYASNGMLYVGFNNRTSFGPHVRKCSSGSFATAANWSDVAGTGTAYNIGFHRVGKATSLAMGSDNQPIFAYDDDFFAPQISVWRYTGSAWVLQGENLLPHFKGEFYTLRNYYLRGGSPGLAVSANGSLYIGMMAMDGRINGANSGPLVMKYVP